MSYSIYFIRYLYLFYWTLSIPTNIAETAGLEDLPNTAEELVYSYDVNSLYPFVMMSKALPTGNIFY